VRSGEGGFGVGGVVSLEFLLPWFSLYVDSLHAVIPGKWPLSATYLASGTHQSSSSHRL
jgi:hypothetical protein